MRLHSFALVASLFLLAACASDSENPATGSNAGYTGSDAVSAAQAAFAKEAGDIVYFDYDSSSLTTEGKETLKAQAEYLKKNADTKATVEGHTDERGTREYNLALGERRANAVKQLLESHGISADRLSIVSYGKERPAVMGSDESAWSQNRRAVTVLN
jgi:peptidoglycan-associated lipoprotein